jgi:hypothetical protein
MRFFIFNYPDWKDALVVSGSYIVSGILDAMGLLCGEVPIT